MIKIAVCDDSPEDGEMVEASFDKLPGIVEEHDLFYSAKELLAYCNKNKETYQMYILDIEMPGMSGLELAKQIREHDARAFIIFLTGYKKYVMEVFDVFAFDYIEKPITPEKLEAVLTKALNYMDMVKQDFVFRFKRNQFRLNCDEILYIQKRGRQAMIHTLSDTYKTNMTIMELWKQLDDRTFSHIHMSYIINLEHIKAIEGDEVILDNREHFIIARSHKQKLKQKHLEFVRKMV